MNCKSLLSTQTFYVLEKATKRRFTSSCACIVNVGGCDKDKIKMKF